MIRFWLLRDKLNRLCYYAFEAVPTWVNHYFIHLKVSYKTHEITLIKVKRYTVTAK